MIYLGAFEDVQAIKIRSGVKAGEVVCNGYPGQTSTAPCEPGTYTLYQLVNPDTWEHEGFIFEKEGIR